MPKVSIIVAAYNIEDYIIRCLKSLIQQSFKELEIIVVNDGSSDSTLKCIESIAEIDHRIKIVNQKNKGLIEARKSGFKVAKGEYVLFVDGDDWIDVKAIEVLYRKAKEKNYDIVQYRYLNIYDNGKVIKESTDNLGPLNGSEFLEKCFMGRINHNVWSKFIRAKYILDNNIDFPDEISYGEDLAFIFSLAINNPKMYIIEDYLYYYYQRSTSLSNNLSEKTLEITKAIEFIKKQLIKFNIFDYYREQFEYLSYKQNYYTRRREIFTDNTGIGKQLYRNWKKCDIYIKNNKYYLEFHKMDSKKSLIISRMMEKSYQIGKIYYRYIN